MRYSIRTRPTFHAAPPMRVTLLILALTACAATEPPTEPPGTRPSVTIVGGGALTDTVVAQPARTLTLLVRTKTGTAAGRIAVTLTATTLFTRGGLEGAIVTMLRNGTLPRVATYTDSTDAQGRLSVTAFMGGIADSGGIVVTAPAIALNDTLPVTVRAGRTVTVVVEPLDTAVYVGASYRLRALALDRFGNGRDTVAQFSDATGGIALSGDGRITGTAIGRSRLIATAGPFTDSAFVSVVPTGAIAAHETPIHPHRQVPRGGEDAVIAGVGGPSGGQPDYGDAGLFRPCVVGLPDGTGAVGVFCVRYRPGAAGPAGAGCAQANGGFCGDHGRAVQWDGHGGQAG